MQTRCSHISIVQTMYFQQDNAQPTTAVDSRFMRWVDSDDTPYSPPLLNIGEEWRPIDKGWLSSVSYLTISNEEGTFRGKQPTQEERDEVEQRVLEIAICLPEEKVTEPRDMHSPALPPPIPLLPAFIIRPKESLRVEPFDITTLRLRCRQGVAKAKIVLFPG